MSPTRGNFGAPVEWTSPGQDYFEALRVALSEAGDEGGLALDALGGEGATWRAMPRDVREIFDAAAARFLSDGE